MTTTTLTAFRVIRRTIYVFGDSVTVKDTPIWKGLGVDRISRRFPLGDTPAADESLRTSFEDGYITTYIFQQEVADDTWVVIDDPRTYLASVKIQPITYDVDVPVRGRSYCSNHRCMCCQNQAACGVSPPRPYVGSKPAPRQDGALSAGQPVPKAPIGAWRFVLRKLWPWQSKD